MMKSNDFEIQDFILWPNYFSLDENRKIKDEATEKLIRDTKKEFFRKNAQYFSYAAIEKYLDSSRDVYYPPKTNQPSYCRAGLHYSIPDDVVGIGLKTHPKYDDEKQWAILYHGTKPQSVVSILENGLRPGGGQAHKGTNDPWGNVIPNGVYFSFWVNQSFGYTLPDNPMIMQCFVKDVYVAPNTKGYTVSNTSQVSRILIPIKKDRTNQLI